MPAMGRKFKGHARVTCKLVSWIAILAEKGIIQRINDERRDRDIFYEVN